MMKLSKKAQLLALGGVVAAVVLVVGLQNRTTEAKDVCQNVRFAHPGWPDLDISIGWASALLESLGYNASTTQVSTAVTFASLKNGDLDIMLANWLPADDELEKQYAGDFVTLGTNLAKMRYTLATTKTAYDAGLKSWQDIPKFEAQLKGKIYGIEPGSSGNGLVVDFVKDQGVDGKFRVIESSTNAMLAEVAKNIDGYIVYLAWDGHWMSKYDPQYLAGGEEYLGAASVVTTLGRKNYDKDCPNVSRFFKNFEMDLPALNASIGKVADKEPVDKVVKDWLVANPDIVKKWMKGVKTIDGEPGMAMVSETLGVDL